MKQLLKWYVLSNVHIALCAVIFLIGGFYQFKNPVNYWIVSYIGLGTFIIYFLHRYIGGARNHYTNQERFLVSKLNPKILFPLIGICLMISIFLLLNISSFFYIPLSVLGLISAAYILPLFNNGKRLRDIGYIKILLIAIVWATVFVLPYWSSTTVLDTTHVILIWTEKCLFILALTLPFDIRDKDLDQKSKVSTIASLYTDKTLKRLIIILILLSSILVVISFMLRYYSIELMTLLILCYGVQYWTTKNVTKTTTELYYLGGLDSFILLHGLIYILSYILKNLLHI